MYSISDKPRIGAPRIDGFSEGDEIEQGMMVINTLSIPLRGINAAVNGLLYLATSTNPVAAVALNAISSMIDDVYKNSSIGKNWNEVRLRTVIDFDINLGVSEEKTNYFLDSIEELTLFGATFGTATLAKAALKTVKNLSPHYTIDKTTIYPRKTTIVENHTFAHGTPAEGFIDYSITQGSGKTILVFLDFIQKGKVTNWDINPSTILGHTPYCTTKAALEVIKTLAKKSGAQRVLLQGEFVNPNLKKFIASQSPFKGRYTHHSDKLDFFLGKSAPKRFYPVYEILSPIKKPSLQLKFSASLQGTYCLKNNYIEDKFIVPKFFQIENTFFEPSNSYHRF